jgi:hypothetical protein
MRFWCLAAALVSLPALSSVVDRVAVSVGRDVITESEIIREIRLTALQNGEEPDYSSSNKREMAERLVDQRLIRMEMESTRYTAPEASDSGAFDDFRARFRSEAQFREALEKYRLSEQDLRHALRWQDAFLQFVNTRFRTGIQIPEEDLRQYYEVNVRSSAAGEGSISFEEARSRIEEILMSERVDNALDRWLGQARTQLRIRFRPEAFE